MIYPLQDLLKQAKNSPYYKATNNQIIDWANNLPIDVVQRRCLLAMAVYTVKFFRQWSNTISEGDFLSIAYIAHVKALDSWDRKHPYSAWFGRYLKTHAVIHIRQSRLIWIPMQVMDKDFIAQFDATDPDKTRNVAEDGSFWDSLGHTPTDAIDLDMMADIEKNQPYLYANAIEGLSLQDLTSPGVKGFSAHQSIDKIVRKQKEAVRQKYFR